MNMQDYISLALLLMNALYLARHHKLSKQYFQKAIASNRDLIAKTLSDLLTRFGGK
jgi:hypothetical protein